MKSSSPTAVLIIMGIGLLYQGSVMLEGNSGDIAAWMSVAGGMGLAFMGFYLIGDERINNDKYRGRRSTPAHIQDIEVGGSYQGILSETDQEQIEALLRQQKIIPAISLYRKVTGHGLREAKDYINHTLKEMDRKERIK